MKIMRKLLVLVYFALITTAAFTQGNNQDVDYLKNVNIVHGAIIEQIPDKSINIETADSNVLEFQMDEIEKITKESASW